MRSSSVSILGMDPRMDRRCLFQSVGAQLQECNHQLEIRVSELCEETACFSGALPTGEARARGSDSAKNQTRW